MKLAILFITAATVALVTPAVVPPEDQGEGDSVTIITLPADVAAAATNDGVNGSDVFDENGEIDGIPIKLLSKDEIYSILQEDDNLLIAQLDLLVIKKVVQGRREPTRQPQGRKKRWSRPPDHDCIAIHPLFELSLAGRVTTSGSHVTRQYARPGNYKDAVRDFNRFLPDGARTFYGANGISGQTGTVGNHRVTVRNGRSNESPTLEIRSPKTNGDFVRTFTYEDPYLRRQGNYYDVLRNYPLI
ncbi:unnamed protein product [Lymnaea stagnalis]|uniref:Uncharacterized protein n=1 Tax=Lymnaea stagnalis TaxID=6523 RepID=A0AAV2ILY7_LYMST